MGRRTSGDVMEYNDIYNLYMNYADKCKKMIRDTFFTMEDTDGISMKHYEGDSVSDIVKMHRLKMIDIKLEHTMRMIEQAIMINVKLGIEINLDLVIRVAVLYHDIGRIKQATWANTYSDSIYKRMNRPYNNHGEEGYNIFINNDFGVDEKYIPIIAETILHHQNHHTQSKLNYRFDKGLENLRIDDVVTGNVLLNDAEWEIASLIVQLVADIDKCDILYQHLSDDFDMIRDYVYDRSNDSLDIVSTRWGVSKSEIIEFNKIDEANYEGRKVKVPIENMPLEKLEVPEYMKKMFYDNSWIELNELIEDDRWHFISILWWRISHFLNQISFTSILVNVEESKLLERIYEKVPVRLRPLVDEAFEYAKEVFVCDRIKQNEGKIYLKRNK